MRFMPFYSNVRSNVRCRSRMLLALITVVTGCAGASVATQQENQAPTVSSRPASVFVYPFAVSPGEVSLNQGLTADQATLAQQAAEDMAAQIVKGLQNLHSERDAAGTTSARRRCLGGAAAGSP